MKPAVCEEVILPQTGDVVLHIAADIALIVAGGRILRHADLKGEERAFRMLLHADSVLNIAVRIPEHDIRFLRDLGILDILIP